MGMPSFSEALVFFYRLHGVTYKKTTLAEMLPVICDVENDF
jgi:hypothetical protein